MAASVSPALAQLSGRSTPSVRSATSPSPALGLSSTPTPTPTPSSGSKSSSSHKPKPVNIFTDDGSFLERFQRVKKEEDEKKKREAELEAKRNFENRFKKRGKRRAHSSEPSTEPSDNAPAKKTKLEDEKPLTAYEKEVKSYAGSLKDQGMGIRPLVK
ncbi:hypothetical protein ACEPAH_8590 [Sanghuangporus vaninii]